MSSKRLHLILVAVLVLLFAALIGGAYGINKMLGSEATKLASLKAKSQALQQEQTGLKVAKKSIKQYSGLEKIAHTVVPEDKNQAEAVRQIVNIAAANGITLTSITFPASTLGNNVLPGASSAPAATSAPKSAANAKSLSQLQPVPNISGIYELPITITRDNSSPVPYNKFVSFLSALEHNRRTAQVSGITITPDTNNTNNLSFILTVNEYIKP
jgi:hypothetical protein